MSINYSFYALGCAIYYSHPLPGSERYYYIYVLDRELRQP